MTNREPERSAALRKIWGLLTPPEQRGLIVLFGCMLVGMALELLGVGLIVPTLALLTQPDYAARFPALRPVLDALGNPSQQMLIAGGMLALVAVFAIKAIYLSFLALYQGCLIYGVRAELSRRLFSVYLRQSYAFHLTRNSAQLINNAFGQVDMFASSVLVPGMILLIETLVFVGLSVMLTVVEPLGTMIVVGVLGAIAALFYGATRNRLSRWGKAAQVHEGLRYQYLMQGLGGVKEVKLLGREADFLDRYHAQNLQTARLTRLQATLQQLPRLWLELLAVGGLAALAISMIARGLAPTAILPMLGMFAAAAFRLLPSVTRMFIAVQQIRYGLPVVENLHAEFGLAAQDTTARFSDAAPFLRELELRNISYTYTGAAKPALDGVSLVIRRGESIGIVGPSGAGKSTLVDVILGLLAPGAGTVCVDGEDIQAGLQGWQRQLGYVPQSIFLTDDSLRRNVAFGLPDAQIDAAAVRRALRAAQLEDFVAGLPEGLDTMVGERGVRLSGGQRQRIGIARALYHEPAVLVLDEATSALDSATESEVMDAVRRLQGSKTVIIVAHRLSTVRHCARLYRLEAGRLASDAGSPERAP